MRRNGRIRPRAAVPRPCRQWFTEQRIWSVLRSGLVRHALLPLISRHVAAVPTIPRLQLAVCVWTTGRPVRGPLDHTMAADLILSLKWCRRTWPLPA